MASPATEPARDIGHGNKLILRGVLAGAIAGLLVFIFAGIFAEPVINQAISYESSRDAVIAAMDKAAGPPARRRARNLQPDHRGHSGSAPG